MLFAGCLSWEACESALLPFRLSLSARGPRRSLSVCVYSVCIAGAVRVGFMSRMVKDADVTWNTTHALIWSIVEPCIGIISACLPTMRPLLRRLFPNCFTTNELGISSSTSSMSRRAKGTAYPGGSNGVKRHRDDNFHWLQSQSSLRVEDAVFGRRTRSEEESIGLDSIPAHLEVEWSCDKNAANVTAPLPPC